MLRCLRQRMLYIVLKSETVQQIFTLSIADCIKGGVKVVSVDGPAARAGLKAGDVIFALSNTDVGTVNEFEGLLSKADTKKPLSVMFRRGDWAQYTLIRPER